MLLEVVVANMTSRRTGRSGAQGVLTHPANRAQSRRRCVATPALLSGIADANGRLLNIRLADRDQPPWQMQQMQLPTSGRPGQKERRK